MKRKLDDVLKKTAGRFFTIRYRTAKSDGQICAKLVNAGPSYITVEDVNTSSQRRLARTSILTARCGDYVYNA